MVNLRSSVWRYTEYTGQTSNRSAMCHLTINGLFQLPGKRTGNHTAHTLAYQLLSQSRFLKNFPSMQLCDVRASTTTIVSCRVASG